MDYQNNKTMKDISFRRCVIFLYTHKKVYLLFVVILIMFVLNACGVFNVNDKTILDENQATSIKIEQSKNVEDEDTHQRDNQDIKDFVMKFVNSIEYQEEVPHRDAESFKELIDKDGIYSITYFIDERDPNKVIHVYKDEIRDDLVLANSENKAGLTLSSLFVEPLIDSEIAIHTSELLDNISFNVDWHVDDEAMVEEKLEDIVKTCVEIIRTNNENVPQVFELKDNLFIFTLSDEKRGDITGDWMIFEKIGNEYKLRVVMQFT